MKIKYREGKKRRRGIRAEKYLIYSHLILNKEKKTSKLGNQSNYSNR